MAGEEGKVVGIEKFNGIDGKMQIEDYMYGKKLHLPFLRAKSDNIKDNEWALLDRQVLRVVRLTLSRAVVHNVVKAKTTASLVAALSDIQKAFC